MKRFLPVCLAILFTPLFIVSCEKEKPVRPTKALSLSQTSKTLNSDAQTTDFKIIAKADWTLSVKADGADWIHPDAGDMSGKKGTTITVNLSVDANDAEEAPSRTGTVEIIAKGEDAPYTFTLTQRGVNTLTGVNEWIYEVLSETYYWNDAVAKAEVPDNSLDYDVFLATLVENAYNMGAKDTSENPPTIDGMYDYENGRYTRDDRYCYSYIERTGSGTRAGENNSPIFGFEVIAISNVVRTDPERNHLLVLWVQPDSPAAENLTRGSWITEYNDKPIYWDDYEVFWENLHFPNAGSTLKVTGMGGQDFTITAKTMADDPIIHSEVITTTKNNKVAYLVYNSFEPGEYESNNDRWGEFDDKLIEIFETKFKGKAQHLVLDLRYNGGGVVDSSLLLSSLIGDVDESDVFSKLWRNPQWGNIYKEEYDIDNPEIINFLNEPGSMDLSNVYVLASNNTASSSELVINSLRGVFGNAAVTIIGERTNGKNVGMDGFVHTIDGSRYELRPITFKSVNAVDFCDYAGGFMPNHNMDELYDVLHYEGSELYPFGNKNERLLKAALTLIDGGTVTPDPTTRAGAYSERTAKMLQNPRHNGMRRHGRPNL